MKGGIGSMLAQEIREPLVQRKVKQTRATALLEGGEVIRIKALRF
tara:strand:+ start:225 stop:359 length:135 start_codon:yes stop_codon:yes gene_type:complete